MRRIANMSENELRRLATARKSVIKRQSSVIENKNMIIRTYQRRLRKIMNICDFGLKYPYSMDSSINTRKHKRDRRGRKECY